ncbi:VOC family protein [Actinomadura sp. KC345]|uniref:VOC family protein n=1 Tax=Actinomadura sp. KC345 TaxID=2530371 RepID=UPI0014047935|nr:VOC family protein [Actinomadura sp. KC345]
MLGAVWHFSFHVSDLDRSVAFYRDVLGMELVHVQEQDNAYTRSLVGYPDARLRVAQLAVPGREAHVSTHDLELVEYVVPRGERQDSARHHPGAAHLAFAVDDIDAEHDRLTALGVRFVSPPNRITEGANTGGAACYFLDPDDITLELVQPPPHRAPPPTGRPPTRVALHSVLREGRGDDYEREHAAVPDDLLAALRRAGIRDWTIWRSGRHLFHLVDADDLARAGEILAGDPADRAWQEHMAAFVDRFEPGRDERTGALAKVWTLREQAPVPGEDHP